jgi:small subunit ribosomal protein S17e
MESLRYLGKVKTEQIKRIGKELLERYPSQFSSSFEENKRKVAILTQGTTARVRNQIAGYITRSLAAASSASSSEEMEEEDFEE